MSVYHLIVLLSWVTFVFIWLILGLFAKKNSGSSGIYRNLAVRIGILAVVVLLFNAKIGEAFAHFQLIQLPKPAYGIIAAFLAVSGVAIAIWARIHLGRNWGMPMTIKEKPQLVTSGPYAFVRHPIYTGVLIAILGSVFLSGIMYIVIFIAAVLYFYYSSKKEEEVLIKTFPKEYPKYMMRTKMLIPFLL